MEMNCIPYVSVLAETIKIAASWQRSRGLVEPRRLRCSMAATADAMFAQLVEVVQESRFMNQNQHRQVHQLAERIAELQAQTQLNSRRC